MRVTFFPIGATAPPLHLGLRVNKAGNVQHLCTRAAALLAGSGVTADRLTALQVTGQNACFQLGASKTVGAFREKDHILLFEQPADVESTRSVFVFSFVKSAWKGVTPLGLPVCCRIHMSERVCVCGALCACVSC